MTDYILFKDLDGKFLTLPEALEVNKIDVEEEEAVDENGEKVEAEVVEEEKAEEPKQDRTIYYVTDEQQQSQYIKMFRAQKMQAFILRDNIDQPFIQQLEAKNEGIHFARIDADIQDALKARTGKKAAAALREQEEKLAKTLKKAVKNDKLTVRLENLKDKKTASILTVVSRIRRPLPS